MKYTAKSRPKRDGNVNPPIKLNYSFCPTYLCHDHPSNRDTHDRPKLPLWNSSQFRRLSQKSRAAIQG
jgi:hypothetical protein